MFGKLFIFLNQDFSKHLETFLMPTGHMINTMHPGSGPQSERVPSVPSGLQSSAQPALRKALLSLRRQTTHRQSHCPTAVRSRKCSIDSVYCTASSATKTMLPSQNHTRRTHWWASTDTSWTSPQPRVTRGGTAWWVWGWDERTSQHLWSRESPGPAAMAVDTSPSHRALH